MFYNICTLCGRAEQYVLEDDFYWHYMVPESVEVS
jgi:hypothetical protein